MKTKLDALLQQPPIAINIGVRDFADALQAQGAQVVHVEWSPPVASDEEMQKLLDELL